MSYKGRFKPKHPDKYKGDPTNIIYRSLWEQKLMLYLDNHSDVVEWSSEEFAIPYRSPWDNRVHRYFPDFYVKRKNKEGKIERVVIEVKPQNRLVPPNPNKKWTPKGYKSRRYIKDVKMYAINQAKFKAAKTFCEGRGWDFTILTERELQPWKKLKKING